MDDYKPYIQRYFKGEWRAKIFHDLILADANKLNSNRALSFLDIGCGGGFDSNSQLQASLAAVAGEYTGVEPDPDIELGDYITSQYRCCFEDAPIPHDKFDIAFSVMVLEHFAEPQVFWDKVYNVLRDGGVFWGFTVDARHGFVAASLLAEKLHIKDLYLNLLHGKRGEDRYENYPVYYRSNTPQQINKFTQAFSSRTFLNFHKIGQLDYYFPEKMYWLGRMFDHLVKHLNLPGSVMAIRVQK